jgi:hypothetical protein
LLEIVPVNGHASMPGKVEHHHRKILVVAGRATLFAEPRFGGCHQNLYGSGGCRPDVLLVDFGRASDCEGDSDCEE